MTRTQPKSSKSGQLRAARTPALALLSVGGCCLTLFFIAVWFFPMWVEQIDSSVATYTLSRLADFNLPDPDVLVLGDSTAAVSIHAPTLPNAEGLPALNGTVVEAYFILKRWLDLGHVKPACAVLSFSQNWPSYKLFFWRTFVRSGFYSWDDLLALWRETKEKNQFPGSTYSETGLRLRYYLYRSRLLGLSFAEIQRSLFSPASEGRRRRTGALPRNLGSVVLKNKIRTPPAPPGDLPDGDVDGLFREYGSKLVDLLSRNHIRLYWVNVPEPATSPLESLPADVVARRQLLRSLAQAAPDSHTFSPHVALTNDDFGYPGHLTLTGAQKISGELAPTMSCAR